MRVEITRILFVMHGDDRICVLREVDGHGPDACVDQRVAGQQIWDTSEYRA
jgi:hypothetical protein